MGRNRLAILGLTFLAAAPSASAQQNQDASSQPPQHHHEPDDAPLFSSREVSGTAWLPNETPMYGAHLTWGTWHSMVHGNGFVQFLYEPGEYHRTGGSGSRQLGSVNWGMLMARRQAGRGRVGVRVMRSVEPWTVRDCGFLNLLATGEMCDGDTIHDRQHPHDLFMELAAEYDRPLSDFLRWQIYGGLSGEPALGPPGFPHRVSALLNPIAPISHHWIDSTHVTFGLVTTGIYSTRWKAEGSVFNGREPDDDRADLDLAALDSFAGRFALLPNDRVALQVSAAHLDEAEAAFAPGQRNDVNRLTASVTYHRALPSNGIWATTLAYGLNSAREFVPGAIFDTHTSALLLESSLTSTIATRGSAARRSSKSPPTISTRTNSRPASSPSASCRVATFITFARAEASCSASAAPLRSASSRRTSRHAMTAASRRASGCSSAFAPPAT